MNIIDIIGPVMIGPSSSHTAGAVRLGLLAAGILGAPPVKAQIDLHGSFAHTYRGHGTDVALSAGTARMWRFWPGLWAGCLMTRVFRRRVNMPRKRGWNIILPK